MRKYQFYKTGKEATLPTRSTANILLDKIKTSAPIQKLKGGVESDAPAGVAVESSSLSTRPDAPVVVIEIPFDTGVKRVVPLNWKLSREQKKWYQTSWDQIFYRGSGETGELTEVMDMYFRRK